MCISNEKVFISRSAEETRDLGAEWGRMAPSGWLLGLVGDLGAGKTQLVKGIAIGLGVEQRVISPTFTLVHEYEGGRLPLCHIDLYRLDTPSQVLSAGLDDYLFAPRGVTVVEWIDRLFGSAGPPGNPMQSAECRMRNVTDAGTMRYRHVRIEVAGETERHIMYEDFSR